jgi:hypothetical protein
MRKGVRLVRHLATMWLTAEGCRLGAVGAMIASESFLEDRENVPCHW